MCHSTQLQWLPIRTHCLTQSQVYRRLRPAADMNLCKMYPNEYAIDTPVLIELKHGSIRYRYASEEIGVGAYKTYSAEHEIVLKRLIETSVDREDPHKFMCVMKGPNSARDKKVFYVYGKGFGAKDGQLTKPMASKSMGEDPNWPQRQNPYDVYYNMRFIEHVPEDDPVPGIPIRYQMEFPMTSSDTVSDLNRKIANTIIKSSNNVHVCFMENVLRSDDIIVELRPGEDRPMTFGVQVTLRPSEERRTDRTIKIIGSSHNEY